MTSDPVGNSPRRTEVPGNSLKGRENPRQPAVPEEEREPIEKVVTGTVKTKKQPLHKRFMARFIADDVESIWGYVVDEYVIPGIKNLFRDSVVGTLDRGLYGTSRARGRVGERGSLRTRYDLMGERGDDRGRSLSRESRAKHDFDDIVLESYSEAVEVIELMIARIDRYKAASVADLYDALGVTGSFADRRWGWYNLANADVRQTRGGFLLDLPRPEPLR